MSISRFPGGLRIGVLNTHKSGVEDDSAQELEPKFQILILLQGRQVFEIDNRTIDLDARTAPVGFVMRIERPCHLRYVQAEGAPYQKISIATTLDWADLLAAQPAAFVRGENSYLGWTPTPAAIQLARQILEPPPQDTPAQVRLYRMSRGLEVFRRALSQARPDGGGAASRAERLRLYLLAHLDHDPDLELDRIEQEMGLNRRSIQRLFKAHFGLTMRDYIRRERLGRAHRALSEDGVSIAQAAHIAGYSTPENFATAFRRAYHVTPRSLRNRGI